MEPVKTALISVSDKKNIIPFARHLSEMHITIVSTGGTARELKNSGIPVLEVSSVTGFPEILDGRVKTLHPKIFAGILADLNRYKHVQQLINQNVSPVGLVVVNLYPFVSTILKNGSTLQDGIENIDIGGPSLIRAAAKNFQHVTVVTSPDDYDLIIEELTRGNRTVSEGIRRRLAFKAFDMTSRYDAWIRDYFEQQLELKKCPEDIPEHLQPMFDKKDMLRYGENPHQKAALYLPSVAMEKGESPFDLLNGKKLSFNNLMDLDTAWNIVQAFDKPAAVVVKHQNPCGVALGMTIGEAYEKALACDPMSAYGGIVAVNQMIDENVAKILHRTKFLELIAAPEFNESALNIMKKKRNRRLVRMHQGSYFSFDVKWLNSFVLLQTRDSFHENEMNFNVVTEKQPSSKEHNDLRFAWKVVRFVKSNAIVMARDQMTVGIGAGQMSRVDSVMIAARKAGERSHGAVLASDAFFPFPDSIQYAHRAGVTSIIQPGGSKRDAEVIEACNELGLSMVFTGVRHFRH